jgi:peptide/nickel transport system substrate-binding protein
LNQIPGHPTSDLAVRQALITAIDPKAFLQAAFGGHGRVSSSFITADTPCYNAGVTKLAPKPSVSAAQKILTDAGWTLASGKLTKAGQPLTVKFVGSQVFNTGPEYIQTQWSQLGVDVVFSNPDFSNYVAANLAGNFDALILQWGNNSPLPAANSTRLSGPLPPSGLNYARTLNPVLDQEAVAGRTTTGDESCKHWAAFQEALWKHWDLLPLAAPTYTIFSRGIDMSAASIQPQPPPYTIRRVH